MSASQIAEIASGVQKVVADGDGLCATFTVAGDDDRWVQFTDGVVNAAYPHAHDPGSFMAKLGDAVVESFEAGQHLTVHLKATDPEAIARWIDSYFDQVLAAGSDYAIETTLESL